MHEAEAFHSWLGGYKHPRTWAIYGTGLETDVEVYFTDPTPNGVQMHRPLEGDGTVPAASANSLFPPSATSSDATGMAFIWDPSKRQFEISGVDHADAFNDGNIRTVIEKMILVAMGCVPQPGDYPEKRDEAATSLPA